MIDWNRPIETVDGKKARVLCTDTGYKSGGVAFPIIVGVEDAVVVEEAYYYRIDGTSSDPANPKLRNSPVREERYSRIYGDNSIGGGFFTQEDADNLPRGSYWEANPLKGLIKTKFEDGKPVSVELLPPEKRDA